MIPYYYITFFWSFMFLMIKLRAQVNLKDYTHIKTRLCFMRANKIKILKEKATYRRVSSISLIPQHFCKIAYETLTTTVENLLLGENVT